MSNPHPLERFPGATKTLTLPTTGAEAVIRRLDIAAITSDATRTVLNLPAVREAAQAWAQQAAEETREPGLSQRPRVELPPEVMFEIQWESERAMLRAALLRPALEELVELYGGNLQTPDLGLGPDYSYLLHEVDGFSGTKPGDSQREQAKSVAAPARPRTSRAGGGVSGQAD